MCLWQLLIILIIISAILWKASGAHLSTVQVKHGGAASDTETAVIMILKTPFGVQEMRKRYIKTDDQPPHITLGYLYPDFDEKRVLTHLRKIKPQQIIFNRWKHTKTFIGLLPANIDEINRIIGPMKRDIEAGPRGGYHLSLAYRPKSAPLDTYTHKRAHKDIQLPLTCDVREIRIARRRPGQPWKKYKSIMY